MTSYIWEKVHNRAKMCTMLPNLLGEKFTKCEKKEEKEEGHCSGSRADSVGLVGLCYWCTARILRQPGQTGSLGSEEQNREMVDLSDFPELYG